MEMQLNAVHASLPEVPVAAHELTHPICWPARPAPAIHRFTFWGRGTALLGTILGNRILTILTFGLYYFWGRAKVRRYLWEQVELDGDLVAFHGTGGELLLGWLKIRGVLLPLTIVYLLMRVTKERDAALVVSLLIVLIMAVLRPFALSGGRRYLLSRTSWRSIRFSYRGSTLRFAALYYGGILLCLLTLGFYIPFFLSSTYSYLTRHSYYGSLRLGYDGKGRDLLGAYAKAFFLGFVTLGVSWFFFAAERIRYCIGHTTVGSLRLASTMSGGKLFRLTVWNILLWIVTLGFATPWIVVRSLRYQLENTVLHGDLAAALLEVEQQKRRAGAMADELADIADMDLGLGF